MAADPIFLMLDEPFRGLDPESVEEIKQVVELLRHQDVGVLMTDYDLRDVFEIVDRAYVIHEGQVVFQGTPDELIVDPRSRHLFLGDGFSL
jgi:lipopolysaccharide export system ATP-binding protein